jgi:hypothetical protein
MPAQLSRLSLRYKQRQMFGRFVRFHFQGTKVAKDVLYRRKPAPIKGAKKRT